MMGGALVRLRRGRGWEKRQDQASVKNLVCCLEGGLFWLKGLNELY